MRKLYFVRHGQTLWNLENKICGATDIPLTELGRNQAEEAGKKIRELGIQADLILHSPLSRAAETARIVSQQTGIPLRVEPRLKEQNFGKYEGTQRRGEEFLQAKTEFVHSFGGGESLLHLAQRVFNLLDEVKADTEKTYILVAHNGIARMVEAYFREMTNREFSVFGVPNCAVVTYDLDSVDR